jgi:hypothetical protein
MKNNKGIIITGGKLESKNVAVGKKTKIEVNKAKDRAKVANDSGSILVNDFKKLISSGELKKVIEQLLLYFKEKENKEGLNFTIIHSSSLTQLDIQEDLGVITHEQGKIDRAKVTKSILQLIDNYIE